MTLYYDAWVEYYYGQSINARVARDINLLQTVNTFFTYFVESPDSYTMDTVKKWISEGDKLSTNIGYDLFERIIIGNPSYRKAIDAQKNKELFTK